jgi:hypothetical protein
VAELSGVYSQSGCDFLHGALGAAGLKNSSNFEVDGMRMAHSRHNIILKNIDYYILYGSAYSG